jgi:NAD(P)-dependent dehydrogenase (short-subunit alcohol dehydrogenase family)
MMKRNHGHIVTMLGSTAVCGLGNFSDICTAKFGLVGLMESIDHELTLGKPFVFRNQNVSVI